MIIMENDCRLNKNWTVVKFSLTNLSKGFSLDDESVGYVNPEIPKGHVLIINQQG